MAALGVFLLKGLTNIKVLAAILIAIFIGSVWFKYHHTISKLEKTQVALKKSEENNQVLRNNNEIILDANKNNQAVINQLSKDKKTATETVNKLSSSIAEAHKNLADLQAKINAMQTAPQQLSPYIAEAIEGIQAGRDKQAGVKQ